MFSVSLSEILVVALVIVFVLDEDRVPAFVSLIKNVYEHFVIAKSRVKKLLKDAGVEDLCKECNVEKVNYIVGEDGKFYPSYTTDSISKDNSDSENPGSG